MLQREIDAAININPTLGANEMQLLGQIAVSEYAGERLTVMDVMEMKDLGSPATLHRRLALLRKHGLVLVEGKQDDMRVKYLHLSTAAKNYFALLDEAIKQAANAN